MAKNSSDIGIEQRPDIITSHHAEEISDEEEVYNPASEDLFVIGQLTTEQVVQRARQLATDGDLADQEEVLIRGARLAHRPREFYRTTSTAEKQVGAPLRN